MSTLLRARAVAIAVALLAVAAWAASPAHAGDKKTGKIDLEASLEPADLAPGGSGTLLIKGTLLEHHHIFAKGEQAIKVEPLKAAGVTIDMDSVTFSDAHAWTDEMGDSHQVWEGTFEFKVKVSLAKDVAAGTKVGVSFTYFGCIENVGCYPPVIDHAAFVVVGAAEAGGAAAGPKLEAPGEEQEGGVKFEVDEAKGEVKITFQPQFGWHFYGPSDTSGSVQVSVEPQEAEGVKWGKPEQDDSTVKIEEPYEVVIPFERDPAVKELAIKVKWAGCEGGEFGSCNSPREEMLRAVWGGGELATEPSDEDPPAAAPEPKQGAILFPVVNDDDIGAGSSSKIGRLLKENPILGFGLIFVLGLGLAFTPCVLPIIPITVSVISGGNADIPRKRLAALLGVYVLGISLAFATMGVVAAMTGTAMSALFAMPAVQWSFVVLFLVLGFGMFGVYELQAPAFLMKLQGGAQKRSGSFIGAFLFGCLGAVIASPCTGPAIATLLIITAKAASVPLGFSTFFVLGLGMGSVVFAVGALNFAMRPGPWMVWVRYTFGILMVAVAFYYLRNYQLISEEVMWVVGVIVCLLTAAGIAWHLHKKEGEELQRARVRGIKVAALSFLGIVFIAWYTRVPTDLLSWTYMKSPEHLQRLVAKSNAEGKPVVVDFWGKWCTNCKVYDKRIAAEPALRQRFERITRLKVDLTDEYVRWPMRHALGVESSGAPVMVFIDRKGRIRRKADLVGLANSETVIKHIDTVLNDQAAKTKAKAKAD